MRRGLADVYRTLFGLELAVMFQYRAAVVIWLLGMALEPVVYLVVWLTVARSRGGQVGDYDPGSLAAYFIVAMLVNHATFSWHMHEMGWRVRTGHFNAILVQPLHPWHRDLLQNVAYKAITLTVMLPTAALLAWQFEPRLDGEPWAMALFPMAVLLAFLLRFFFEWALALLAFWVTDTSGLNDLYWTVGLFLSGRMAPLGLLPGWAQGIAEVLPFRWTVAFPVELLCGRVTPAQALQGLGLQAVWLTLGAAVVTLAWRRASARYAAVGA